jgi:hypothetical protein
MAHEHARHVDQRVAFAGREAPNGVAELTESPAHLGAA